MQFIILLVFALIVLIAMSCFEYSEVSVQNKDGSWKYAKRLHYEGFMAQFDYFETGAQFFYVFAIVLVMSALLVLSIFALNAQVAKELDYDNVLVQREVLVVQLERAYDEEGYLISGDIGSMQTMYSDVAEFNRRINTAKYWSQRPWFKIYVNELIADIEPIDLLKYTRD